MPALADPPTRAASLPAASAARPSDPSLHDPIWTDAERAVWLLAVDPSGLGGVCVHGPDSPTRQRLLDTARKAWPVEAPWLRLPVQIDDERLLGGLDLGLSLAAGKPVRQPGLLASGAGGVLLIGMAERVSPALAGKLAAALDRGPMAAHEGGADLAHARQAPCTVIALDNGAEPDERPAAALLERLALHVVIDEARSHARVVGDTPVWPPAPLEGRRLPGHLDQARERLGAIPIDAGCIEAFCRAAEMLGVPSMRVPLQAWRTACAAAALAGHEAVTQADAELAARLVIAPRARHRPVETDQQAREDTPPTPSESSSAAPPPSPEQAAAPEPVSPPQNQRGEHRSPEELTRPPESPPKTPSRADALPEQVMAAAQAAIPEGLLLSLAQGLVTPLARSSGRSGATAAGSDRGRPLPSRRGDLRGKARLDLLATLRAAVPWQALRRPPPAAAEGTRREVRHAGLPNLTGQAATTAPARSPTRLLVRREDFHIRRCRQPQSRTVIFAVDASGSQALHRLAEAKGAVELLLADCYVQRDRVALVAFRGAQAQVLLPPTRSLVRARRSLTALPGGGGTPLAAGIAAADLLAQQVQREAGQSALVVLLTDARANVALDGLGGREQAMDDALRCARRLREHATPALMIDTGTRPDARGRVLAQAMAARHVVLPQANAASLHRVVHAAMHDSTSTPRSLNSAAPISA